MTDINQNSMDSRRTEFRVGSEVTDPTYGVGRVIRLTTAGAIVSSVVVLFYKIAKEYEFTREGVFNLNELRVVGSIDTLAQVGNTVVNTVKEIAEGLTKPGTAVAKETLTWRQLASQLQGMKFRENGQLYNIVQKRLMSVVARYENTKILPRLETITDPDLLMEVLNPLFPEDWAKDILLKALSGKKKLPVGIQIVDKPGTSQINKQLYAKSETKRVSLGHRLDESIKLKEYAGVKAGVGQPAEVASAFSPPRIGKPTVIEPPQPIKVTSQQLQPRTIEHTIARLSEAHNPFDKTKVDGKIYEAMDAKVIRRKEAADLLRDLVAKDTSTEEHTIDNVMGRIFNGDKHYRGLAEYYSDLMTYDHTGKYVSEKYDFGDNEIVKRMTTYVGKSTEHKALLEARREAKTISQRELAELSRMNTVEQMLSRTESLKMLSQPNADVYNIFSTYIPLEANHAELQSSLIEMGMFVPDNQRLSFMQLNARFGKKGAKLLTTDKTVTEEMLNDLQEEALNVFRRATGIIPEKTVLNEFLYNTANLRLTAFGQNPSGDIEDVIKTLLPTIHTNHNIIARTKKGGSIELLTEGLNTNTFDKVVSGLLKRPEQFLRQIPGHETLITKYDRLRRRAVKHGVTGKTLGRIDDWISEQKAEIAHLQEQANNVYSEIDKKYGIGPAEQEMISSIVYENPALTDAEENAIKDSFWNIDSKEKFKRIRRRFRSELQKSNAALPLEQLDKLVGLKMSSLSEYDREMYLRLETNDLINNALLEARKNARISKILEIVPKKQLLLPVQLENQIDRNAIPDISVSDNLRKNYSSEIESIETQIKKLTVENSKLAQKQDTESKTKIVENSRKIEQLENSIIHMRQKIDALFTHSRHEIHGQTDEHLTQAHLLEVSEAQDGDNGQGAKMAGAIEAEELRIDLQEQNTKELDDLLAKRQTTIDTRLNGEFSTQERTVANSTESLSIGRLQEVSPAYDPYTHFLTLATEGKLDNEEKLLDQFAKLKVHHDSFMENNSNKRSTDYGEQFRRDFFNENGFVTEGKKPYQLREETVQKKQQIFDSISERLNNRKPGEKLITWDILRDSLHSGETDNFWGMVSSEDELKYKIKGLRTNVSNLGIQTNGKKFIDEETTHIIDVPQFVDVKTSIPYEEILALIEAAKNIIKPTVDSNKNYKFSEKGEFVNVEDLLLYSNIQKEVGPQIIEAGKRIGGNVDAGSGTYKIANDIYAMASKHDITVTNDKRGFINQAVSGILVEAKEFFANSLDKALREGKPINNPKAYFKALLEEHMNSNQTRLSVIKDIGTGNHYAKVAEGLKIHSDLVAFEETMGVSSEEHAKTKEIITTHDLSDLVDTSASSGSSPILKIENKLAQISSEKEDIVLRIAEQTRARKIEREYFEGQHRLIQDKLKQSLTQGDTASLEARVERLTNQLNDPSKRLLPSVRKTSEQTLKKLETELNVRKQLESDLVEFEVAKKARALANQKKRSDLSNQWAAAFEKEEKLKKQIAEMEKLKLGPQHVIDELSGERQTTHKLMSNLGILEDMFKYNIDVITEATTKDGKVVPVKGMAKLSDKVTLKARTDKESVTFDPSGYLSSTGQEEIKTEDYLKMTNQATKELSGEIKKTIIPTKKRLVENNGVSTFLEDGNVTGSVDLARLFEARQKGATALLLDTEFFRNNIFQVGYGVHDFQTGSTTSQGKFIQINEDIAKKMRSYLLEEDTAIGANELKYLRIGIKNTLETLQEATKSHVFGNNTYKAEHVDAALNFMTNQLDKIKGISAEEMKVVENLRPITLTSFVQTTLLGSKADYLMNQNIRSADIGTIVRQLSNEMPRQGQKGYKEMVALIEQVKGLEGKSIDTMLAMFASTGKVLGLSKIANITHDATTDIEAVIKQISLILNQPKVAPVEDMFYVNKTTGHIYKPSGEMKEVSYSDKNGEIDTRFEQDFKRVAGDFEYEKIKTLENITVSGPTEGNLAAHSIDAKFHKYATIDEAIKARKDLIVDKAARRVNVGSDRKSVLSSDMYYVQSDIMAAQLLRTKSPEELKAFEENVRRIESYGVLSEDTVNAAKNYIQKLDADRAELARLKSGTISEQSSEIKMQEDIIKQLSKNPKEHAEQIAIAQEQIARLKAKIAPEKMSALRSLEESISQAEVNEESQRHFANYDNWKMSETQIAIAKRVIAKNKAIVDPTSVRNINTNTQSQMLYNLETVYENPNSIFNNGVLDMHKTLLDQVDSKSLTINEANRIYKNYMTELKNSGVISPTAIPRKNMLDNVSKKNANASITLNGKEHKFSWLDVTSLDSLNNSINDNMFKLNEELKQDITQTRVQVLDSIKQKFGSIQQMHETLLNEKINITDSSAYVLKTQAQKDALAKITSSYQEVLTKGSEAIRNLVNTHIVDNEEPKITDMFKQQVNPINTIQHELLSTNESIVNISKPQIESVLNTGGMETAIRGMAESAVGMHNKFGAAGIAISALLIGGMMLVRPNLNANEKTQEPEKDTDFSIKDMLKNITKTYKAIDKFSKNIDDKILGKERKQQNEENEHNIPMHRVLEAPINAYKSVDNFAERMDIRIRGTVKKESGPDIIAQITHNVLNTVTKKTLGVDLDEKRESKNPDKYWARGLQNKL